MARLTSAGRTLILLALDGKVAMGVGVAAGVFYRVWGWSLRPEVSALLMSASSILVAVNAVMLRRSGGHLLSTESAA